MRISKVNLEVWSCLVVLGQLYFKDLFELCARLGIFFSPIFRLGFFFSSPRVSLLLDCSLPIRISLVIFFGSETFWAI